MKVILTSEEARKKLKKGVDTVADIVKTTLGNGGRNVIFEKSENLNITTNDGITIANQIFLEDEIENMGANLIKEAGFKTNLDVGDGTTTTILLTQEILNKGFKMLSESTLVSKVSPIKIKKQFQKDLIEVLYQLDKASKKIKTKEEREQVAMTSVEDEKLAKMISEILGKVGDKAHISIERTELPDTSYEITEGIEVNMGWFVPFMVNTPKGECKLNDPYVLVMDSPLEDPQLLGKFTEYAVSKNKPLVVIADNFSPNVIGSIAFTKQKTGYEILAIKSPEFQKEERLKDVALITGATFLDSRNDMKLEDQDISILGQSKEVVADRDITHITGGYIDPKVLKQRLDICKDELKNAIANNQKAVKESFEKKITQLTTGSVIINVGADSKQEREYKYHKVEDAVNATRVAMQEGIIRGGGVELLEIAKLLNDNILKDIITKPNEQILKNNNNEKIPKTVIDPTKVVKTALKTAVSVAGTLLTTEATIAIKKENIEDSLKKLIK